MSDGVESDTHPYTVRLELIDRPGELLRALEPIADHGGNLLSIFHERGNITPRGHIPVEVDLECPPDRFDEIVDALRAEGINVIQAGADRYGEEITVLLVGHLVDTDLSDTISRIERCSTATVADLSLMAPEGTEGISSARLRLAAESGTVAEAVETIRSVAEQKELSVIDPVQSGGEA